MAKGYGKPKPVKKPKSKGGKKVSEEMELSPIFTSHKKVKRCPMNRADYNIYRGRELPKDEDGSDDGYLVECLDDDGKPNHPHHSGYISWSPKLQFDNGYRKVDNGYTFDNGHGKLDKRYKLILNRNR